MNIKFDKNFIIILFSILLGITNIIGIILLETDKLF